MRRVNTGFQYSFIPKTGQTWWVFTHFCIEDQSCFGTLNHKMVLIFSGIFLFTFRDMGYLGKLILGIFAHLLKGIWDICLFTSRDMGYWGPPIQASLKAEGEVQNCKGCLYNNLNLIPAGMMKLLLDYSSLQNIGWIPYTPFHLDN